MATRMLLKSACTVRTTDAITPGASKERDKIYEIFGDAYTRKQLASFVWHLAGKIADEEGWTINTDIEERIV